MWIPLHMAAFAKQQSWIITTEPTWPQSLKCLLSSPLQKMCADLYSQSLFSYLLDLEGLMIWGRNEANSIKILFYERVLFVSWVCVCACARAHVCSLSAEPSSLLKAGTHFPVSFVARLFFIVVWRPQVAGACVHSRLHTLLLCGALGSTRGRVSVHSCPVMYLHGFSRSSWGVLLIAAPNQLACDDWLQAASWLCCTDLMRILAPFLPLPSGVCV